MVIASLQLERNELLPSTDATRTCLLDKHREDVLIK